MKNLFFLSPPVLNLVSSNAPTFLNISQSLELISYDFPLTSNNVNETNNKIYFKFEDLNKDIKLVNNESDSEDIPIDDSDDINIMTIPHGNYDVSNLIKKLNKLGKMHNLIFSYNKNTSKVTIKSEEPFSLYRKENNILNILGYDNSNILTNDSIYSGNLPYDLRKCNYIYIHLNNISENEFAIVNTDTSKKGTYFMNTESIKLDKLDIEIKDEFGNLMDFCNLSFKLELNIIFANKDIKIDDDNINNKMNDSDSDNISINSEQLMETNI